MNTNIDCTIDLTYNTTTKLYELFYTTYNGNPDSTKYQIFFASRKHNGRMDKVSHDIYGTNKYVSTLCLLNQYLDPHSISDGDILVYLPLSDMESMKNVPNSILDPSVVNNLSTVKNDLINLMKSQRLDGNRKKFLDNVSTPLPPTVLPSDAPVIVVKNNEILIAPNLFNNPNTVSDNAVDVTDTTNVNSVIQKVLVKQYKLKAN